MTENSLVIFKKYGEAVTRIQRGTAERYVVEREPGSKHFTIVGKNRDIRERSDHSFTRKVER